MFLIKKKSLILVCFILLSNLLFSQDSIYQNGLASYYSDAFQGRHTYSGEKYNNKLYTAAHATLPLHTIVKVTNVKNNKSVIVKINDRCFKSKTRIIDLSKSAASQIDILASGIASVTLTILAPDDLNIVPNIDDSLLVPISNDSTQTGSIDINKILKAYLKYFPHHKTMALTYLHYPQKIKNTDTYIAAGAFNNIRKFLFDFFPAISAVKLIS